MVRQYHQLNGYESEQIPGDSEGQGSLACCSPWGDRVGHDLATEQQHGYFIPFMRISISIFEDVNIRI